MASKKDDHYTQPYLLSLGVETKPTQYFVIGDKIAISAGMTLVPALDRLFKCHYIFDVKYSLTLQQFWDFFAAMIYYVIPPAEAKPGVRTF